MKKQNLSKNIVMILFLFSFVVVCVVSIIANYFITFSIKTMEYNIYQRIITVSKVLSTVVTAEELDRYKRVEDMDLPSYQALRHRLAKFAEDNDVLYAYYERAKNNLLQYIIDNDFDEETRVGLDTPPYEYLDTNPWIIEALHGKSVSSPLGNYSLGWEGLMTAYTPVFDREGNVNAIAGVDIDDTPIVKASRMVTILTIVQISSVIIVFASGFFSLLRFRREAEKARAASVAKSNFLSSMSHEIRTPLNAIIGMGELALYSDTMPKMVEYLNGIKQAGNNLLSLVNDILDFSKIETGSLQIVKAPYCLASLLNDVINVVHVRLTRKPVLFTVNIDAQLPARMLGDEARIRQILFNLLSNAIKYTKEGLINLRVTAGVVSDADEKIPLTFTISDTGIGIKQEDMAALFHDFVRLDIVKNKSIEGSGLGLTITRNLCRAMGGDILVSSEYGKGSVFVATVPQERAGNEKLAVVEKPAEKGVLIYDHREAYRESVMETLRDLGVPVAVALNDDDFIKKLSGGDYAFVFFSSKELDRTLRIKKEKSLATVPVLLADIGEISAVENARVLSMPAYAAPIAGVLNGSENILPHKNDYRINFVVPSARFLVVDDIPANLVVAEGLLSPYRAKIDTCSSGAGAIEFIKAQSYDIVFMDHMMPEMDGIETVRHIRSWENGQNGDRGPPNNVPIVALTANAVSGMREMFLGEGFNDYLTKPIDTVRLSEVINQWVAPEKKIQKEEEQPEEQIDLFGNTIIDGIDLAKGQKRYRAKYPEVLRAWCVHTPELLGTLREMAAGPFDEKAAGEYTICIHGLKGATHGIFAGGIAEKAEQLEAAARRKDIEFITANNDSLIDEVSVLLKKLEELLAGIAGQEQAKPSAPFPDPVLLAQLYEACKQYKSSLMEDILVKIDAFQYESGGELIQWLHEQMDNLEYDLILERLNQELEILG